MAFNPSNPDPFFGDYRQFGTLYTKDQASAQSRLDDLQAALAYAQTLPDTDPNKAYFVQEATQAINGQKSDLDYIMSGQSNANASKAQSTLADIQAFKPGQTLDDLKNIVSVAKTSGASSGFTSGADSIINSTSLTDAQKQTQLRNLISSAAPTVSNWLTGAYNSSTDALNQSKSKLLETFNLTDPNWGAGERNLQDYYKNQAIPFATEQAKNDIYQSAYNISKGINQRMISSGLGASGLRKKALSDVKGQALGEFGKAVGAAENEAAGNIKAYKDQAAAQERAQRDLERRLQTGTAEDIFSGSNQDLIGAYNTNTQAQQQKAMQDAQKQLAQQQSSDRMLNDIFGTAFGAAGDIFSGGLI